MSNKTLVSVAIVLALAVVVYLVAYRNNPEEGVNSAPQGKIDINAVCEGALAYMSFMDGASAEAFVQECKEGKHPEVIEKFKADMNLGAGAEI